MKAAVLYSGGKDSSFMAVMLKRLGLDVELCTANFGVYDSYIPAGKSAESLGFTHKVLNLDFEILDKISFALSTSSGPPSSMTGSFSF